MRSSAISRSTGTWASASPSSCAWRCCRAASPAGAVAAAEPALRGVGLVRRWGGVVAVNGVSIDLHRGEVHALIGTNGAGKSTLVNVLSGEIAASAGRVELAGEDVTRWPQPRRARAG